MSRTSLFYALDGNMIDTLVRACPRPGRKMDDTRNLYRFEIKTGPRRLVRLLAGREECPVHAI
jgi:hypothetical protein